MPSPEEFKDIYAWNYYGAPYDQLPPHQKAKIDMVLWGSNFDNLFGGDILNEAYSQGRHYKPSIGGNMVEALLTPSFPTFYDSNQVPDWWMQLWKMLNPQSNPNQPMVDQRNKEEKDSLSQSLFGKPYDALKDKNQIDAVDREWSNQAARRIKAEEDIKNIKNKQVNDAAIQQGISSLTKPIKELVMPESQSTLNIAKETLGTIPIEVVGANGKPEKLRVSPQELFSVINEGMVGVGPQTQANILSGAIDWATKAGRKDDVRGLQDRYNTVAQQMSQEKVQSEMPETPNYGTGGGSDLAPVPPDVSQYMQPLPTNSNLRNNINWVTNGRMADNEGMTAVPYKIMKGFMDALKEGTPPSKETEQLMRMWEQVSGPTSSFAMPEASSPLPQPQNTPYSTNMPQLNNPSFMGGFPQDAMEEDEGLYTTQEGDNLWQILANQLEGGNTEPNWSTIATMLSELLSDPTNMKTINEMSGDPNLIYSGQQFKLPKRKG